MTPNPDILYFTLFPWDNAYSSVSLSFTREFIKNNRVFYINPPYSVKDFIAEWRTPAVVARRPDLLKNRMRYETIPELPEAVAAQPPLTLPVNWLPEGIAYRHLLRYNNWVVLNCIRQVVRDFKLKDFIYINCFNPYLAGVLPKDFGARLSIYQCIDDMREEAYTARHGARLEEEVIRRVDLAFVTSRNLLRLKKPVNPNTHLLHNAADISIFQQAMEKDLARPVELAGIAGEIIGFTGNLDPNRINYGLLRKVAERHTDKTLVLVGPVNSSGVSEHGLDRLPNVVFTGGKHISELPAFLQHFDVVLIPFSINKLTSSIYPLKINEYLAAGKPVVSTDFSEDIRGFEKDIYLAKNEEDFIGLIPRAIAEDSPRLMAQRLATARQNTWTERVKQFWVVVNRHLEGSLVAVR
jgi:glycosyltransferase involved in cell wall biosynthesis